MEFIYLLGLFGLINYINGAVLNLNTSGNVSYLSLKEATPRLPLWTGQPLQGEQASLMFYQSAASATAAKDSLQLILHNFLENLQKNFSTINPVPFLNHIDDETNDEDDLNRSHIIIGKLNELAKYFEDAAEVCNDFARKSEYFFEIAKNESESMLHKLRQIPFGSSFIDMKIKMDLTDYFGEMEYFHVTSSEMINEALEYISEVLLSTQKTFKKFSDFQKEQLEDSKITSKERCTTPYINFLSKWSDIIYKCAAGQSLNVVYDVYAMTETTIVYIMHQLEYKIQRLYNCFLFGNYQIKCRYLHHPEKDFEKLFAKLDELQMYFDTKIRGGRVLTSRQYTPQRRRRMAEAMKTNFLPENCTPDDFPHGQILNEKLQDCLH